MRRATSFKRSGGLTDTRCACEQHHGALCVAPRQPIRKEIFLTSFFGNLKLETWDLGWESVWETVLYVMRRTLVLFPQDVGN